MRAIGFERIKMRIGDSTHWAYVRRNDQCIGEVPFWKPGLNESRSSPDVLGDEVPF